MCGHLECEDCSGIKVAKLRSVMNSCNNLYFTCSSCDAQIRNTSEINIIDTLREKINVLIEELGCSEKENTKLTAENISHRSELNQHREKIASLEKEKSDQDMQIKMQGGVIQKMQVKENHEDAAAPDGSKKENVDIDAKLEAFSANILSKVTEIMDKKIGEISTSKPVSPSSENESALPPTWSNVVSQSSNIKTVMRAAKNDEKIEESEKLRRANNIIIHGAEEIGGTPEEIKKADEGYIKEIFAKIGVETSPTLITRLGAHKENGSRPIKLVMKTKEDKEKVMSNLGKLKNTERYFGKISLKDDYTANEREQIKMLTDEAKKKRDENPERDFRVRGDAKNGWRIVSFQKK